MWWRICFSQPSVLFQKHSTLACFFFKLSTWIKTVDTEGWILFHLFVFINEIFSPKLIHLENSYVSRLSSEGKRFDLIALLIAVRAYIRVTVSHTHWPSFPRVVLLPGARLVSMPITNHEQRPIAHIVVNSENMIEKQFCFSFGEHETLRGSAFYIESFPLALLGTDLGNRRRLRAGRRCWLVDCLADRFGFFWVDSRLSS